MAREKNRQYAAEMIYRCNMFDFEKFEIYQVIRDHNVKVQKYTSYKSGIDESIVSKWKNASLNILIYLSEGTGRMNDEKRCAC